jgi:hypothetical protein
LTTRIFPRLARALAGFAVVGAAFAAVPALADPAAPPQAPAAVTFPGPQNASQSGVGASPGDVAGGPTGAAAIGWTQGNSTELDAASNTGLMAPFLAVQDLDATNAKLGNVRVAHDSIGRIHAIWYHAYANGSAVIYYGVKNATAGAGGWTVRPIPVTETDSTLPYKVDDLAIGPNNRVYVIWGRNNIGVRLTYSDDGVHWAAPEEVPGPFSNTAADFGLGVSTQGVVIVGWFDRNSYDILTRMKINGAWGPLTNISDRGFLTNSYTPRFAAAPDGGLRVIWNEEDPNQRNGVCGARGCRDIWYREWSPVTGWDRHLVQLFRSPGETNGYAISVDAAGVSHIVFDDDSHRPARDTTIYYVRGQGTTFTAPQPVVPQFGLANGRFPDVDANGNAVHVVLNSNVGGAFDNYYTWTAAGSPPTPPPTATPAPPTATPVPPTPCTPGRFSDVPAGSPYYAQITDLVQRGAISGYSDCSFRPGANITRGQVAKVLVLGLGLRLVNPAQGHFTDVPPGSPFYTYIETAYARGIISGYADHTFRPGNPVTRGQLAKMSVTGRGWTISTPRTPTFSDVGRADPFYTYIETASRHGVISGYTCGTNCLQFRPTAPAIRGQAAKVIDLAVTAR